MSKPKYLKHPVTGRVLVWTKILAERGDMIPCDADGTPLPGDGEAGEDSSFQLPDIVESLADGWGLGDPEKRSALEKQLDDSLKESIRIAEDRRSRPYDGVMGELPDWVPDRDRGRFEWERNLLLNHYSHEQVLEFLEMWPDAPEFAEMHRELVQAIDYLVLIKQAIDSGKEEGIQFLAGELARKGLMLVVGASRGHEVVHGTKEEKEKRWTEYQTELERVHRDNPRWGITSVRQEVADHFGVSYKTIQRHTKKTW